MTVTKVRRRRDERKPVKVITNEWVEDNCMNLTERDMEILKLLVKFPLLNSEHIRLLTPAAGGEKAFWELKQGVKRCNERIRMLFDLHCVNKWSPRLAVGEGTSKQYVALDRAGCKLLGVERRIRHDIPQDWRHKSLVMDVYCTFVTGERDRKWKTHYLHCEQEQQTFALIPDVVSIVQSKTKGTALFIEVDRSEKKEAVERQKLEYYRNWQLSQTWVHEPWCAKLPQPFFPTVLYLFDETKKNWKQRANRFRKMAEGFGLRAKFIGMSELEDYLENIL